MKKIILVLVSSLLFLGILAGCGQSSNQAQTSDDQIQTVHIVAEDWKFIPDTINVKPGKVKFVIENKAKRMHGFAIDELGINESLAPGKTVEKIVDVKEAGSYTFYCSVVCGDLDQHGGMKGTLTVQ